ncbi:acylphosphatase [Nitrospira sp.]|nr:acylphosphatase [Nitrospira sp.]
MTDLVRAHVLVSGRVQGVAFRAFTREQALDRGLRGGVRNLEDGRVEAFLQGPRADVMALIDTLRVGPRLARVDDVAVSWSEPISAEATFSIWY